jgi:replicative DNA helicase
MEILPYDVESEDSVLGSVIFYNEEYDKVSKYFVNREVFYQKKARLLWNRITEMKRKKEPIDTITVCSSLTEKETKSGLTQYYVTKCTGDVGAKGATEFRANKIYEKYLLRKIIVQSDKVKQQALANESDVYESVIDAHALFGELINIRPTNVQDIEDVIADTLESIKNKTSNLIGTGYNSLDKFSGGLTRGEITIVGGRPGHGKTTVLINLLAKALEQGKRAMFFSRELPNAELLKKILCLESGKLSYSMVRQNVFTDLDLEHMNEAISFVREKYSKDKFLMFDNIKDFSLASSEIKKFKPDIIFDDYIQLVACKGYQDSRRLQIEKLVNDYKWLAKETNAVVVLASQLNRYVERANTRGKSLEPQLSDLAESGAIEQVAENVFFSYYDYKVKGEKGKGKNVITLIASKIRYGDSGTVDLGYDGNKCKLFNTMEDIINDTMDEKLPL